MDAEDVVDAICRAVEAGDFAAVAEHVDPDGIFHGTVGGLDEGMVLHGQEAFARYFEDVAATWDEWRIQTEEVLRNGDTFVVFWRETSTSHGLEMQTATATMFTIRNGKVSQGRAYLDRAAALEAAGISG